MSRKIEQPLPSYPRRVTRDGNKFTVQCTNCGREVKIIPFGYGYIAACCNRVIYSGRKLPASKAHRNDPDKDNKNRNEH